MDDPVGEFRADPALKGVQDVQEGSPKARTVGTFARRTGRKLPDHPIEVPTRRGRRGGGGEREGEAQAPGEP